MKKTIILSSLFLFGLQSCSKHDHHIDEVIVQDITVELLANEAYSYTLPMENVVDNYLFATNSFLNAKTDIENNVFKYTAPAQVSANSIDEIVISNDHHSGLVPHDHISGASEQGNKQHYTVNFHIKFVEVKVVK